MCKDWNTQVLKSLIFSENAFRIFKRNPFVRLCGFDRIQEKRQSRFLDCSHYKFAELTLPIGLSNLYLTVLTPEKQL